MWVNCGRPSRGVNGSDGRDIWYSAHVNPDRLKLALILGFLAASLASGLLVQYHGPRQPFSWMAIACVLLQAFLMFMWYRVDAQQKEFRRSVSLDVAVVGLAVIGLPYYLFRTRGFRGGVISTALLVLLMWLAWRLQYLGAVAAYRLHG